MSVRPKLPAASEVPYTFARDHHVLVGGRGGTQPGTAREVWISEATPPLALAELQRVLGPIRPILITAHDLQRAIQETYSLQDKSASAMAMVASEVEGSLDLSQ